MSLFFLRGQAAFMRAQGMDVHVMTAPGKYLNQFAADEGITAHAVEMQRRITPIRDLFAIFRIHAKIRTIRPDIVHASTPKGGLLGTVAARLARVPLVIYHIRGLAFTGSTGTQRVLLRATEKIATKLAHRVLCVSSSVRDEAVAEGVVAPEKTVVLGAGSSNGVAASTTFNPGLTPAGTRNAIRERLGIPSNASVVGFVGRLVRDKGLVELADAWEQVSHEVPGAWLLIVGPWEPRDPVPESTRAKLEAHPQVKIAGEQSDMAPFYSAMDLVVLPTYREGFPNVPLEAAAMNLPVIVTRVTGCVDAVVDGVTGLIVPPRSASTLADAMVVYLRDVELRQKHGAAGRQRALLEFDPEQIWIALHSEYVSLRAPE